MNRTNFKSNSEFNNYLKEKLNILFPDHIKDMVIPGKYSIYDNELNISIIIYNDTHLDKITIVSIVPGYKDVDVIKLIEI